MAADRTACITRLQCRRTMNSDGGDACLIPAVCRRRIAVVGVAHFGPPYATALQGCTVKRRGRAPVVLPSGDGHGPPYNRRFIGYPKSDERGRRGLLLTRRLECRESRFWRVLPLPLAAFSCEEQVTQFAMTPTGSRHHWSKSPCQDFDTKSNSNRTSFFLVNINNSGDPTSQK